MSETGKVRKLLAPWVGLTMVLAVACGALVIALIASNHANGTAKCVNDRLGDRNGLTATNTQAQIDQARSIEAYAKTQLANSNALVKVFQAQPGAAQTAAFESFIAVLKESGQQLQKFVVDTDAYVHTLVMLQNKRDASPLGTC